MKAGSIITLLVVAIAAAILWPVNKTSSPDPNAPPAKVSDPAAPIVAGDARQTWGRMETLADHFARHGRDFGARDAEDYAAKAAALLQRARTSGLPVKRGTDGTIRVYEPATGAFGAYNANGTTKTFFKPGDRSYFERQPGMPVDLRATP